MKKIEVKKENGKIVEWIMDYDVIGFDIYESNGEKLNLSITDGISIKDFFELRKSDFPVLTDVFLMTADETLPFYPHQTSVGVKRRDDVMMVAYMFDDITATDDINGIPGNEMLRYLEMRIVNDEDYEILIPYEFDDIASIYIGIRSEFDGDFKKFFEDCNAKLLSIISETETNIRRFEKSIQDNKFVVELPKDLIVPFTQYLTYFRTYVKRTKNLNVEVKINELENGIQLVFSKENELQIESIKELMLEFISLIGQNVESLKFPITAELNENELSVVTIGLKQQVSHLRNSLDLVRLENKLLKENNAYIKELMTNVSRQPIQINNYLKNDTYNYINEIVNSSELLDNTDRELVKLIYENCANEEERNELIKNLKTLKDKDSSKEEKKTSTNVFRKFMETGLSEASKQIFKKLVETGFEILAS